MRTRAVLGLALAVFCAVPAFAWSPRGHRTVARLAQSRLSPDAQRAVAELLGPGRTLEQVAACADMLRGERGVRCAGLEFEPAPWSAPWHYVDVPVSASPRSAGDLAAYCARGDCVLERLRADALTLASPRASRKEKLWALMFLVHFMGDVHQPLHCAAEIVDGVSDRGGNGKAVTWAAGAAASEDRGEEPDDLEHAAGDALNLHALWDRVIQPRDVHDPAALSLRLERDLAGRDTASWTAGDFAAAAALESFQISKTAVYPAYHAPRGDVIDPAYQARMEKVAFLRLQQAGVRLAALLDRAFSPLPSPAPARRALVLGAVAAPSW